MREAPRWDWISRNVAVVSGFLHLIIFRLLVGGGMMLSWKFIYNVLLSLKFLISFYETNSHRTQTVFALALICAAGFYCDTDDFITSVLQYYLSTKLTAEICSCNRCQC